MSGDAFIYGYAIGHGNAGGTTVTSTQEQEMLIRIEELLARAEAAESNAQVFHDEWDKSLARAVRAEAVVEAAKRVDVIYEGLRMDANDGSFALWSELDLCGALHDLGYAVSGLDAAALAGQEGNP